MYSCKKITKTKIIIIINSVFKWKDTNIFKLDYSIIFNL